MRVGMFVLVLTVMLARGAGAGPIFADCSGVDIPVWIDGSASVSCSLSLTYSTEITARMTGGPLLYDQIFTLPFADPSVQAAVASAQSVVFGGGAISDSGPTLVSQQLDYLPDVTTVIGPATAIYGTIGPCQGVTPYVDALGDHFYTPFGCAPPGTCVGSLLNLIAPTTGLLSNDSYYSPAQCGPAGGAPLFVGAGNINVNLNVDHFLTQVYEVDGFTSPEPVPEPGPIVLLCSALALTVGGRRLNRCAKIRGRGPDLGDAWRHHDAAGALARRPPGGAR